MKNKIKRAKLLLKYIKGSKIYDFGGEEDGVTNYLRNKSNKTIILVNKVFECNDAVDLNYLLPYADDSIKCIICCDTIEHLYSPFNFLKECKRVLKDKGRMIITTPNSYSFIELRANVTGYYPKRKKPNYPHHLYTWGKYNFNLLCREAGFDILKFKYIQHFWRKNLLFRFLSFIFPILKPSLFYVLEKNKKEVCK